MNPGLLVLFATLCMLISGCNDEKSIETSLDASGIRQDAQADTLPIQDAGIDDEGVEEADAQPPAMDAAPPAMDAAPPVMDAALGCDPEEAVTCDGPRLRRCLEDGSGYTFERCANGQVCRDAECVEVRANIVLILDTSGSMNILTGQAVSAGECMGDGCPPWTHPMCDDPMAPQTRMGQAKQAIRSLVQSDAVADVSLALARFPQTEGLHPLPGLRVNCEMGWYANHDSLSFHSDDHEVERELLDERLPEVVPVAIGPNGQTNTEEILRWTNFAESVEPTGEACRIHRDCPGGYCHEAMCHRHTDPELRAVGTTPIGQSLFYAAEYLRHYVVREGAQCAEDADCASANYACVDGTCHDPFFACRPNVIVMFSDGQETDNDEPDNFFNPRIQAKRLHYGLGCIDDSGCLNGARCQNDRCVPPVANIPTTVCRGADQPCMADDECPPYPCGLGRDPCPGECVAAGLEFSDEEGYDLVRNMAGLPVPMTVHVVDASGDPEGNSLIALLGGGVHRSVNFADAEALIDEMTTVIGRKAEIVDCE